MGFDSNWEYNSWKEEDDRRKRGIISVNARDYEELKLRAEKVKKLEDVIDYILTAQVSHYNNSENMLNDFKTVINLTLNGK